MKGVLIDYRVSTILLGYIRYWGKMKAYKLLPDLLYAYSPVTSSKYAFSKLLFEARLYRSTITCVKLNM